MKKNIPFIIVYSLAFIVTVVNIVFSIKGSLFSDIKDLPEGKYISCVESPDGKGKINLYRIDNKLGIAVRGEYEKNGKKTNVFWQTGIDNTETVWHGNNVVNINGVDIDVVDGGFYDCRRGVSLFQSGAIEGEEVTNE